MNRPELLLATNMRGYWLPRYMEENKPRLLLELLAKRLDRQVLDGKVADAFGMDRDAFMRDLDAQLQLRYGSAGLG